MPQKINKFWEFKNKSEGIGELSLYGEISSYTWWGDEITPSQFKKDLDALGDISTLNVYINSPGGDVFAGQAIHSMLKRHDAKVNVFVDGLAASIASVIAMAGDSITMPANAMMMIHKATTFGWGDSDFFMNLAEDLEKIEQTVVNTYISKTGQSEEKIKELMKAETWMTADEALELAFIDEITEEKQVAASIKGGILVLNGQEMDLSKYSKSPKFVAAERAETNDNLIKMYELQSKRLERMIQR